MIEYFRAGLDCSDQSYLEITHVVRVGSTVDWSSSKTGLLSSFYWVPRT